jgi:hypothetical protein
MNFGSSTYTGGRQPPLTSYVKSFYGGSNASLWTFTTYTDPSGGRQQVLTPSNNKSSVYIVKDLIVGGSINNPSDAKLKKNVEDLPLNLSDKLMDLNPKQYTYIADEEQKLHYGLIAQDVEVLFPNLVSEITTATSDEKNGEEIINTIKTINYLELVPVLLLKIQDMQKQIDDMKLLVTK